MKPLTNLPKLTLTVAGEPLRPEWSRHLLSLRVVQRLCLPAQCELSFVDPDSALERWLRLGMSLCVQVGARDELLFAGELTALEFACGPSRLRKLRVRGYDPLHRLGKQRQPRAWTQASAGDIARELCRELPLTLNVIESGPTAPYLVQARETDLAWLQALTERAGLYFSVAGETLHLFSLAGIATTVPLQVGDDLHEASIELNAQQVCSAVEVTGWDPSLCRTIEASAERVRVGEGAGELVRAEDVGGASTQRFHARPVGDEAAAEAWAQAELDRRRASAAVLRGCAAGNARLVPGARVQVSGLAAAEGGSFVLTHCTHLFDAEHGFISELSSEMPSVKQMRAGSGAWLGVVSHVDDPEAKGRVRVRLPALEELETTWLQVLAAAAGKDKGCMLLPDVGDTVLVCFLDDDPARGVVLGGLYGLEGPHDAGVDAGVVQRYLLLSRSGHRLQLDDAAKQLVLRDARGSVLELGAERVRLSANAPLVIEAPGQSLTIRAHTIDFEQA